MCGIAGAFSLSGKPIPNLTRALEVMGELLAHRGPDGEGVWISPDTSIGLAHRRLSIIDLSEEAAQPMTGRNGTVITYNGETYNYRELHKALSPYWPFKSHSDTETILAAYDRYGEECVTHLRGMFSFALVDPKARTLFAARDRFGIKPFYYAVVGDVFYFASEAKALLPFLPSIEIEQECLTEYFMFQYSTGEKVPFKGIRKLLPAHRLSIRNGKIEISRYWDVKYHIDYYHAPKYYHERLEELFHDSVQYHLRSDVPVASYLSGGVDSSLITLLAHQHSGDNFAGMFHGRFVDHPGYDESHYADLVARSVQRPLHVATITAADFERHIGDVIYHLDWPTAGPGSFPQYMVSKLAGQHVKVILGGQGGDEIFGGYARYILAYFEQCIKASIDGTYKQGQFVVTPESIIPNLSILREYKPMIKEFWREGLFEDLDDRYLRLCDRSTDVTEEVDWRELDKTAAVQSFKRIFNNEANTGKQAYFDKMTHYDFKCLLPALLHVEDRVSMAHGLEARVPFLDHPLVEFAATIPANVKFDGGRMKLLLKETFGSLIPKEISNRRDKMGFPVPLQEWFTGDLRDFMLDTFSSQAARSRPYTRTDAILKNLQSSGKFSRKTWGFLSLELWYRRFHDRAGEFARMLDAPAHAEPAKVVKFPGRQKAV
jgi:asparagine synthase (glutamine-hydrolysing)